MLIKRVITAVVLLVILAVDLSLENLWPLLIFLSAVVGLTAFEWLRLTAPGHIAISSVMGLLLGLGTLWQAHVWLEAGHMDLTLLHVAIVLSSVIWLTAIPAKLWTAQIHHQPKSILWSAFAPICLYATWGALALFWINEGAWSLLSLLLVIWINISPGKTREGALFGLAGVLIWMLITAQFDNSYAFWLQQAWGWVGLVFGSILLGALAIMGDLFESYLKRQANVKDSSRLLPGHGGVYDRVDAVVAVVPVAYLLISEFWFR